MDKEGNDARACVCGHLARKGEERSLIVDGLHALQYWEYATELDLPRRDGQVLLPEDDPTCWRRMSVGDDESNAIDQIRVIRDLISKLESVSST